LWCCGLEHQLHQSRSKPLTLAIGGDSHWPDQDKIRLSNTHGPTLNARQKLSIVQNCKGEMLDDGHAFAQQIGRSSMPVRPEGIIE
jgi:hypothetical protein